MGLFSRSNNDGNGQDEFDEIDLPSSEDLKGGLFTAEETNSLQAAPAAPAKRPAAARGSYGIEDAIKLMKSLPRDNNEVVVTVVKKTLESTNIRVPDIVEDANQKETRIRNHHKTLEGEIKELQDQIAQRNQQISDLLHDLKETTDVRQRLQLAMELDGEKPVAPPARPAAQAEQNPEFTEQAPVSQTAAAQSTPATNSDPNLRRRAQQRTNPNPPH